VKKFLFALLIVMVGVFNLSASPIHPPGVDTPEMVVSGYSFEAVTPGTVLTLDPLAADSLGSIIAEPVYLIVFGGQPSDTLQVLTFDTGQSGIGEVIQKVRFPLLC
jgi:hypothetical protein